MTLKPYVGCMRRLLFVMALMGTATVPAAGQDTTAQRPTAWLTLGAGRGFFGTKTGIGAHVSITFQFGANVLSMRSSGTGDILETLFGNSGDIVGTSDWGVLYGRATPPGRVHASIAAGIGSARVYRGAASGDPTTTVHFGVPLEGQLFLRVSSVVGVGLYGYGNLNKDRSYWGLSAAIELGRLR